MDHQKFVVDPKEEMISMTKMVLPLKYTPTSPWQYLNDWQKSDRGYDPLELEYINKRMQDQYPGKYKIVKKSSEHGRFTYYDFEFESPAEETMFRLTWI